VGPPSSARWSEATAQRRMPSEAPLQEMREGGRSELWMASHLHLPGRAAEWDRKQAVTLLSLRLGGSIPHAPTTLRWPERSGGRAEGVPRSASPEDARRGTAASYGWQATVGLAGAERRPSGGCPP